jgi:hypothetical protein
MLYYRIEVQQGTVPFFELAAQMKKRQKKWKKQSSKKKDNKTALGGRNWVAKVRHRAHLKNKKNMASYVFIVVCLLCVRNKQMHLVRFMN